MGLVVLAVLVGAMIAFGWQRRDERPLTFDPPTASYQPADLSVVCENTRMTIGGALTVDISDEFSVAGPKVMQPLNQLQCRGLLPDETGGNALLALGIAPAEEAARSVREEAETAYRTVVAGLYVGGAAEESEVVGGAADGFGDAWRITAVLVGPKKTGRDHVELIVVDLGAGRRAVWLQLVGEGVSPDTRAIFDAARKSLRRV